MHKSHTHACTSMYTCTCMCIEHITICTNHTHTHTLGGRLVVEDLAVATQLAAYALQAELGDQSPDPNYFSPEHYLPPKVGVHQLEHCCTGV